MLSRSEGWRGSRRELQEKKEILLRCSVPRYRTSPAPAYRGHLLDAALLGRSSCTRKCCTCPVSAAVQAGAEGLAGKTPACGSARHWGSQAVPQHPGTQHPKQPQPESLLHEVVRSHSSQHLFCLYILRETSKPRPKIATDRSLLFSRPENLHTEASDLFPKRLKNRERKQNVANSPGATQSKHVLHKQCRSPTVLRSTSLHTSQLLCSARTVTP